MSYNVIPIVTSWWSKKRVGKSIISVRVLHMQLIIRVSYACNLASDIEVEEKNATNAMARSYMNLGHHLPNRDRCKYQPLQTIRTTLASYHDNIKLIRTSDCDDVENHPPACWLDGLNAMGLTS